MDTNDRARTCIGAQESFAPQSRAHQTGPRPARGHMPFKGHRTVAEWDRPINTDLSWCPPEYREWHRYLRNHDFSAAEARDFIEKQIAADEVRCSIRRSLGK